VSVQVVVKLELDSTEDGIDFVENFTVGKLEISDDEVDGTVTDPDIDLSLL
jgi:hypothetical protein